MTQTPTNRTDEAGRIAKKICETRGGNLGTEEAIASAITSAVEAERERCALLVRSRRCHQFGRDEDLQQIADAIRQTPTKEWV